MNKINYYNISQEEISKIKELDYKPTLLLHVCCGPCSTYPLTYLTDIFDVTIMFNNSNIYPESEYIKRLDTLKFYIQQANIPVTILETPYNNQQFTSELSVYKDEPEGGKRCELCFRLRMDEAYKYASENNYDYFTTVMTVSRQKNSQVLNQIGEDLSSKYSSKYFYSDFKKKDGTLNSNRLTKEYNLYSQLYCGCIYSLNYKDK